MSTLPPTPEDLTAVKFGRPLDRTHERRAEGERRSRIWWSLLYGSLRPRRRRPARRVDDSRFQVMDWHGAHLWAVSLAILILCVADAFLTLTLMAGGAVEVNPVMAMFMGRDVAMFAGFKIAMTGASVLMMVFLARYRFMRLVRVEVMLYAVLTVYVVLMIHELRMLQVLVDQPLL
jgi:uncharacterized protein DUF5658